MFLAPNFFGGAPPEFLKSIYKIRPDSDHVAKFKVDRSRDLRESVAKKKTLRVKHKPVRNGCSGRPNNTTSSVHNWFSSVLVCYFAKKQQFWFLSESEELYAYKFL